MTDDNPFNIKVKVDDKDPTLMHITAELPAYMDVAGFVMDGFGDATQEDFEAMAKTGQFYQPYVPLQITRLNMSDHIKNCKCQPIWEKNGVRVEGPGDGADRVDVKCDWCQNRLKETE